MKIRIGTIEIDDDVREGYRLSRGLVELPDAERLEGWVAGVLNAAFDGMRALADEDEREFRRVAEE